MLAEPAALTVHAGLPASSMVAVPWVSILTLLVTFARTVAEPCAPMTASLVSSPDASSAEMPRTIMVTLGAVPAMVALAVPEIASLTLNGPSTRIRSKPLTPKLRLAASAGAARAKAGTARKGNKVRMARTFTAAWLRSPLNPARYEHWTLPEPARLMLHLAPPVTRTSPDPAISTDAVPVAWAETLPEPAIDTAAVSATTAPPSMSPDPAIS